MPLVIIDLIGGNAKLIGMLQRRMLEIRSGVFVGSLSKRSIDETWTLVKSSKVTSAAIVFPAKNEIGFQMYEVGSHSYSCVDHYGIPLIQYSKVGNV